MCRSATAPSQSPFRIFLTLTFAALFASFLAGCASNVQWRGLVKIGLVAPFNGYDTATANEMLSGARSAIAERLRSDSLGGYGIEIVALNDAAAATPGDKAAEILLDRAAVAAILWADGETLYEAFEKGDLPIFLIGGPLPPPSGSKVVQLCAHATAEGRAAASHAEKIGVKRAAVVSESGFGYQAAAHGFKERFKGNTQTHILDGQRWWSNGEAIDRTAQLLASEQIDFAYFSTRYELAALLASRLEKGVTLLAGSNADTPAFDAIAPKRIPKIERVATCRADIAATGPRRAGMLAWSATDVALQAIQATVAEGRVDRVGVGRVVAELRKEVLASIPVTTNTY